MNLSKHINIIKKYVIINSKGKIIDKFRNKATAINHLPQLNKINYEKLRIINLEEEDPKPIKEEPKPVKELSIDKFYSQEERWVQ